ncbi:radical SAM protein [bacterium]|nr:radical SAM protein [bacterium]
MPTPISPLRRFVREYKRSRLEARLVEAVGEGKKRANSDLNWREFWHEMSVLRSRPRLMQIGTNWTCNLRCNFCRLTLDETQKALKAKPPRELEISPAVLQKVIDLMPYPEMMTLTPLGEPMLYSKFGLLLEKHREFGSNNLSMTTNANLITDDRARMLVEGGMSHMFVSVDSSDAEVYAGMRVRGDLAKVEAALESINKWKRALNSETPRMTLASTFMERNVRQMPDLLDFAVRHRFDVYSIQLMETENQDLAGEFLGHHLQLTKEMLLETLRRANDAPIEVRATLAFRNLLSALLTKEEYRAITRISEGASGEVRDEKTQVGAPRNNLQSTKGKTLVQKCHYPWYFMLIDTDGDCRPCCWSAMSFGNLNEKSFDEVWNSPAAVKMRTDFLNNHIPKACQGKHCRVDMDHFGTLEQ